MDGLPHPWVELSGSAKETWAPTVPLPLAQLSVLAVVCQVPSALADVAEPRDSAVAVEVDL